MEERKVTQLFESLTEETKKLIISTNKTPIIIDLFPDKDSREVADLSWKWNKLHPNNPCIIIPSSPFFHYENIQGKEEFDFENSIDKVKNENEVFKIYLIAHHSPGEDTLTSEENDQQLSYQDLAQRLAFFITINKLKGNVTLNLLTCSAASSDDNIDASFTEKLQLQLKKVHDIDIPIVARTYDLKITKQGRKMTVTADQLYDEINQETWRHKQKNSKVIVASDKNGHQIRVDAYEGILQEKQKRREAQDLLVVWKERVIMQLNKAKDKTKNLAKKEWLGQQIAMFNQLSDDDIPIIYHNLEAALKNHNSILNSHSNSLAGLFKQSDASSIVEDLLKSYPDAKKLKLKSDL